MAKFKKLSKSMEDKGKTTKAVETEKQKKAGRKAKASQKKGK